MPAPTTQPQPQHTSSSVPFYGLPRPLPNERSVTDSKLSHLHDNSWFASLTNCWHWAQTAVRDPTRADAVAAVGELTGHRALHAMVQHMRAHPTGRQLLRERPLVSKATLPYARLVREAQAWQQQQQQQQLEPPSIVTTTTSTILTTPTSSSMTFGQAYGLFLLQHGFDPDERTAIQYLPPDSDEAYVMLRYRQCHDFWHTLTGLPPTVAGELGLKWLELFQTQLPVAALACTAGMWSLSPDTSITNKKPSNNRSSDRDVVWNTYLPWARACHNHMQREPCALLNVYYEREFETPLDELRQRLRILPAPAVCGGGGGGGGVEPSFQASRVVD